LNEVSDTDTRNANNARVKEPDDFALKVTEITKEIYQEDGFTTGVAITSVLNARQIKTSRGSDWTTVQVGSVAKIIKKN
jgi:hypothetical protein